ncbi:hypothetical protein BD560DRAFT_400664 [Blakeslea trispora]|nr:hypothetical protein BD560DRAFT_400664 [Blakeslea trispora]
MPNIFFRQTISLYKIAGRALTCQAKRTYIRPHYYQQESSLSKALERQRNPFHQFGRRVNRLDPNKVLWGIIGTNVGVFLMWRYAYSTYQQFGDSSWVAFMYRHFTNTEDAIEKGRFHTLLTSSFSHSSLNHLGLNMLVLYSIGQGVLQAIGVSRFLLLYTGAGLVASLTGVAYRKYIRPSLESKKGHAYNSALHTSLGASGSVMGITTFFACAFPRATFLVFFIVPMPAAAVVGLYTAYDLYQAYVVNKGNMTDSAGHLGGVAYGAAYWFLRVRPMLRAGKLRV